MFVKIAKVQQDKDFIAACDSMGWEGEMWKEVWDELRGEDKGYITNFDVTKQRIRDATDTGMVDVFCTCANRWFALRLPAITDSKGNMWVHEQSVLEF
jgi:hypothetical protein